MQLMKAYVAKTSWYRLYNENEGLSYIHAEGEARGRVYLMNSSSNCITGLYQNATNEIHLTKMVAVRNCRMQCRFWHFHHRYCLHCYIFMAQTGNSDWAAHTQGNSNPERRTKLQSPWKLQW